MNTETTPATNEVPAAVFPGTDAPRDNLGLVDLDERVSRVREMLLVGLAAFGEIERLDDKLGIYEMCKIPIPPDLRVVHPTGSAETIGDFADALRSLNSLVRDAAKLTIATAQSGQQANEPAPAPTALQLFANDTCIRAGSIHAVIMGAIAMLRRGEEEDLTPKYLFAIEQVLEEAAKLAESLSGTGSEATRLQTTGPNECRQTESLATM